MIRYPAGAEATDIPVIDPLQPLFCPIYHWHLYAQLMGDEYAGDLRMVQSKAVITDHRIYLIAADHLFQPAVFPADGSQDPGYLQE